MKGQSKCKIKIKEDEGFEKNVHLLWKWGKLKSGKNVQAAEIFINANRESGYNPSINALISFVC